MIQFCVLKINSKIENCLKKAKLLKVNLIQDCINLLNKEEFEFHAYIQDLKLIIAEEMKIQKEIEKVAETKPPVMNNINHSNNNHVSKAFEPVQAPIE